ncbi:hypothetical protein CDAR_487091 [Caerostris darwini]|uniref:Uncharacterized protein n=1 Tax=Caerostris darwini TaxID=1538125 RepID=A0AAV4TZN6_9ARAC|nr:hypothetical protein CDAR_487091 [Caerostris darwini]
MAPGSSGGQWGALSGPQCAPSIRAPRSLLALRPAAPQFGNKSRSCRKEEFIWQILPALAKSLSPESPMGKKYLQQHPRLEKCKSVHCLTLNKLT